MKGQTVDLTELGSERLYLEGSLEPGEIDFSEDEFVQLVPLDWSGWVERKGAEVRFAGNVATRIELTCVRCLARLERTVERSFDLFFQPRGDFDYEENAEIELKESETQTAFFVGDELRPSEIMREQILLALPMKPLCKVDCRGLCPMCGQDLNANSCGCSAPVGHPAFEVLASLRERGEERSS